MTLEAARGNSAARSGVKRLGVLSSHSMSRRTARRICWTLTTRRSRLSWLAAGSSSVRRSSSAGWRRSRLVSSAIGALRVRRAGVGIGAEDDRARLQDPLLAGVGREEALAHAGEEA